MDDINVFAKNEKELETLIQKTRINREYIEIEFGIEKMCQADNEKEK